MKLKLYFTRSFLLALALLVSAEVVVRAFFTRNMSGRFEYGYNATSGFEEKPDGTLELVRAGGRRFRPQKLKMHPDPGVLRIFVVGDSVPRGPSLEKAYPRRLGEMLNEQGVKTESYNLGLAGNGAHRSQIVLQQALKYEPGLIVLHVNTSNEFEDEREWKRKEEFNGWHPGNWPMKSLVVRRLYEAKTERVLWEWLPASIREQGAINDSGDEQTAGHDAAVVKRWRERVRKYVTGSVALCRARHVPLIIVAQAFKRAQPDGTLQIDGESVMSLVRPLAGEGVEILSMKDVLAGQDIAALYADTSHVRAEGHELLAAALAKLIKEKGLPQIQKSR